MRRLVIILILSLCCSLSIESQAIAGRVPGRSPHVPSAVKRLHSTDESAPAYRVKHVDTSELTQLNDDSERDDQAPQQNWTAVFIVLLVACAPPFLMGLLIIKAFTQIPALRVFAAHFSRASA